MPARPPLTPRLSRLLRALHRRGTALHIAECAGVGLLTGAGVAIALTVILWFDHRSSGTAVVGVMVMGVVAGLLWGLYRRPSPLASAVRADMQFDADDLFATAASLSSNAADPWAATILAIAERRSREMSPSAVILRRLGGRAWGGITLATATAVTLAVLASTADPSHVEAGTSARSPQSTAPPPPRPLIMLAPESPLLPQSGGRQPGDGDSSPDRTAMALPPASRPAPMSADARESNATSIARPDGAGTGAGQTATKPTLTEVRPAIAAGNPTAASSQPGTRPAGGIGVADGSTAGAAASGSMGESTVNTAVPPWQATTWPNDVNAARQELQTGKVPAAYRDLVREYFEVK